MSKKRPQCCCWPITLLGPLNRQCCGLQQSVPVVHFCNDPSGRGSRYRCHALQEPVPEITALRRGDSWRSQQLYIHPDESTPLEGVVGSALDIEVVLER